MSNPSLEAPTTLLEQARQKVPKMTLQEAAAKVAGIQDPMERQTALNNLMGYTDAEAKALDSQRW